jgi:hypothetical protein
LSVVGYTLLIIGHWLGSNKAVDFTIRSLTSLNANIYLLLELRNDQVSLSESKGSWEILIQNGNLSLGVISRESGLSCTVWIIKFNVEVKIWLPIIVVVNHNLLYEFWVSLLKSDNFIDLFVLLSIFGSVVFSSDTERDLLVLNSFDNSDINGTTALSN